MLIQNWSYREWNYQRKFHQNMSGETILIPAAPIVTEENSIEVKNGVEKIRKQRCVQSKTYSDGGTTKYKVFENSEGHLYLETQDLNGEHTLIQPVFDCIQMRAHMVCEPKYKRRVVCIISLNDFSNRIVLFGKRISVEYFEKVLISKKIPILIDDNKRKIALKMVFMYLMGNATVSEIPDV